VVNPFDSKKSFQSRSFVAHDFLGLQQLFFCLDWLLIVVLGWFSTIFDVALAQNLIGSDIPKMWTKPEGGAKNKNLPTLVMFVPPSGEVDLSNGNPGPSHHLGFFYILLLNSTHHLLFWPFASTSSCLD
jgi:hypothetical protein